MLAAAILLKNPEMAKTSGNLNEYKDTDRVDQNFLEDVRLMVTDARTVSVKPIPPSFLAVTVR